MKKTEKKELHAKTENELKKLLSDAKESVMAIKFDKVQNKLKNTRSLFNTRKKIAIIQTILKGKELQKNA